MKKLMMAVAAACAAVGMFVGNDALAGFLPPEYQEVEYVESTGSQFIDTGVVINKDHELQFKYAMLSISAYKGPFGTYQSENHNATRVMANNGSKTALLVNFMTKASGGGTVFNGVTTAAGDIVEGYMNYNRARFNDVEQDLAHTTFGTDDPSTLKLLGRSGYSTSIRLYSFRILEDGIVKHDYVPCYLRADATKVGFYDTVGKSPYMSTGLVKGEDVNRSGVFVSGDPRDYATAGSPVYGYIEKSVDETVDLIAPEVIELSAGSHAVCMGWKLYDGETGELVNESTDANKTHCSFVYKNLVQLVWQWKVQHLLTPAAADGLTITPASAWVGEGEEAAFTVTGADYPAWTVNGVAQPGRSASIAVKGAEGLELSVADSRLIYVTQDGAGQKDGTSWDNAFDSIQAAVDAAGTEAAVIFLLQGDYTLSTELSIGEGANLAFVGGCTGSGSEVGTEKSALIRDTSVASMRLVNITGATGSFSDMVVRGGRLNPASSYGHGVNSANSALAFTRCTFDDNGVTAGSGSGHCGGGLAANGGSVKLNDCAFTKNVIVYNSDVGQYGAGIWAKDVALEASGCLFATNSIYVQHFGLWGGAIYATATTVSICDSRFNKNYTGTAHNRLLGGGALTLISCPTVLIDGCVFDGNFTRRNLYTPSLNDTAFGGSAYMKSCPSVIVRNCILKNGYTQNSSLAAADLAYAGCGHEFYLYDCTAEISRTVFYSRGLAAKNGYSGLVDVRDTALAMTNVLMVAGKQGCCLGCYGDKAVIDFAEVVIRELEGNVVGR